MGLLYLRSIAGQRNCENYACNGVKNLKRFPSLRLSFPLDIKHSFSRNPTLVAITNGPVGVAVIIAFLRAVRHLQAFKSALADTALVFVWPVNHPSPP